VATEATLAAFWMNMTIALAVAVLTTRIGLSWGEWMSRLRR
jgi:ABC-type spermidine/putrescine transport system permease subunit II